jgi:putative aminopeptidase FrvX
VGVEVDEQHPVAGSSVTRMSATIRPFLLSQNEAADRIGTGIPATSWVTMLCRNSGVVAHDLDRPPVGLVDEHAGLAEGGVLEVELAEGLDEFDARGRAGRRAADRPRPGGGSRERADVGHRGSPAGRKTGVRGGPSSPFGWYAIRRTGGTRPGLGDFRRRGFAPPGLQIRRTVNTDLLKRLCETPGVPGREERVRDLIEEEIDGLFDEVETDAMGSLICRRSPRTAGKGKQSKKRAVRGEPRRIMQLCHMDEIGFYVRHVDDKGFLWLNNAGGFDPRNLFSRRVLVVAEDGDFKGVMNPGGKPIHTQSPRTARRSRRRQEFFVDVGMSGEEAKKKIQVGDYVVMDEPFIEMGDKLVSKALDNRVACWLGIESGPQARQERRGARVRDRRRVHDPGGGRAARREDRGVRGPPDIGIGIDVTLACDTPGVPEAESVTTHGKGFALHLKDGSFISDHELVSRSRRSRRRSGSRTSGRSSRRAGRTAPRPSRRRRARRRSASPSARGTSTP